MQVHRAIFALRHLGCAAGDTIAIWLPNRPEWPVLTYAAAFLGLCVVPVNTRLRPIELAHVLRHSLPRVLFTQQRFLTNDFPARLRQATEDWIGDEGVAATGPVPRPQHVVMVDDAECADTLRYGGLVADAPRGVDVADLAELAAQRRASDPLWLFWTSGTTSSPKGVLLAQRAITAVWNWTKLAGYRHDDRVLMTRPLFYVAGHFWCLLGPLLQGALSVVGERFTSQEMLALCRDHAVTVLSGNPLLLKALVDDPAFDASCVANVRLGYFGGSSVSAADLQRIRKHIPYEALLHVYGASELGGLALSTRPGEPLETAGQTCGLPLPDVVLRLVDPDTGTPAQEGAIGMLLAKADSFLDYVGVTDEDRARLVTDDGWVRTGDLLRIRPDGRYVFVGRTKDLIKVGGENVTAAEIEATLLTHPDILQAAVMPVADAARGQVPLAYIQCVAQSSLQIVELQAWCRDKMAPFKVPREFRIVESWPMTATGKIAKHELEKLRASSALGSSAETVAAAADARGQ